MKKIILLFALFLFIVFSIYFFSSFKESPATSQTSQKQVLHKNHLFDKQFFSQADDSSTPYQKQLSSTVFGGIIPHHLTAAPLIAGFFDSIKKQKITTVILLSPNHYGQGNSAIITSKGTFQTLFGNLETDIEKVSLLEKKGVVSFSEPVFETEHGIYGITPFIKKTFPETKIVPILLMSGTTQKQCDVLIQSLQEISDANTLVLVSSDFSHNVSATEAAMYNQETIATIRSFSGSDLLQLDHTKNSDSPESLYVLTELMKQKNKTNTVLLANTNSAVLTFSPNEKDITSYVSLAFTPQEQHLGSTIFSYIPPEQASIKNENSKEYTIIATGDIIPARSVNAKVVGLNDFTYPFKKTVSVLKSGDVVFTNIESPLIPNCPTTLEGMIFCGDEKNIHGLLFAGVTVASLANNHIGNHGLAGIQNTISLLKKNNILATGTGDPAIVQVKDKKFGFVSYNAIGSKESGIAWVDEEQIKKDIARIKKQADFVIVGFHWGTEYVTSPTTQQISLAHLAIDAGADLIIGNHPHWVQKTEWYKNKFIAYAHGNYIFDQMWSQETREGVIGKYTFNEKGLVDVAFVPIVIDDYSQARFATEKEAQVILKRMQ